MKKSLSKSFIILSIFAFTLLFFSACKKDDDNNNPITPSGPTLKTSVTGRVTDTNGNVLIGVTVKLGSITTVTDIRGNFLFVNIDVPKTRMVLKASKTGFFDCILAKKTQSGAVNYLNLLMEATPAAVNISGTAGGVVNIPGGATITFPVNAFVDANGNSYTGQVKVFARHISPGENNFEAIVPGGDLLGVNLTGQTQSLYSFGMIEAKLYDNSGINEIKIAPGKTAELKFPIDPSQSSAALSTIPLWSLNETSGFWKEEGQAAKSGNFFIGNVSHFSTWNCDYQGVRTDIQGQVVDCQNNPMANVVVTINGFMTVVTDNSGNYTTWVPAGYLIQCQVLQVNNPFISANSPIQSITAVAGQLNTIPVIIVPCATRIAGTIKTCGGVALTPAYVYLNWNGGSSTYFSSTGIYNMYVPENTNININASTYAAIGNTSITSGPQGTSITVPDIHLCNLQVLGQTRFTIDSIGISSTTYLVNIISSNSIFTDQNLDGIVDLIDLAIQGATNPGSNGVSMNFHISTATQIDNYYELQSLGMQNYAYIQFDSTAFASNHPPLLTNNHLIITDYGSPGAVMSGTFNFDTPTGSISDGEFSIIRNN